MYVMDESIQGRMPRHEGIWGMRVVKKHKNSEGERVETILQDKIGEIPMSDTMNPQSQASVGTSRGSN